MMVSSQAEDLWHAIEQETDPVSRKLKMVEFAKLVLKHALMDDTEIKDLSETDTLTDFFIEYLDAGNYVNSFFNHSLPHLEPELKGQEFEEQIKDATALLGEILKKSENLLSSHSALLEQKNSIAAESKKLRQIEAEVEELKKLEEKLTSENMASLDDELHRLRQTTEEKKPELEKLEKEKDRLEGLNQHIETTLETFKKRERESIETLIDLSGQLTESLDHGWDENDERRARELRKLKQKNKMYHDITTELEDCMQSLKKVAEAEKVNREIYDKHFSANKAISKALDHGAQGIEVFAQGPGGKVTDLSKRIAQSLKEFDTDLKKALEANEETVSRISRLNIAG